MKRLSSVSAVVAASAWLGAFAANPYISRVFEFCPAPGQFVHSVPLIDDIMTPAEVIAEVERQICGNEADGPMPGMISLGAFGGYVVFGFDGTVENVAGEYDFRLYGNSFAERTSGSAEPGVVMVSADTNGNGLPDDEWFELAGSEYGAEGTIHGFEVTYYRPADDKTDIRWTSNNPTEPEGVIARSRFHEQSYWPGWYAGETIVVKGTRLAPNAVSSGEGDAAQWTLKPYEWGYADNRPDAQDFKIDWAVDADGNPAGLTGIDFVKVYTGVLQNCGWLGETSTELCGGENLHALASLSAIKTENAAPVGYFNLQGIRVSNPSAGSIYIRVQGTTATKICL